MKSLRFWLIASFLPWLALQIGMGRAEPAWVGFPLGVALAAGLVVAVTVMHNEWGERQWVRSLRSARTACGLLLTMAVWCVVGGLVPPGWEAAWAESIGLKEFTTAWPFLWLIVLLLVHLQLVLLHRLKARGWRRSIPFLLVHGGVWLALGAGFVGSSDLEDWRTAVGRDEPTRTAYDRQGHQHPLPYSLRLRHFEVQRAETDGSVVQFRADVEVDEQPARLAVNAPYRRAWNEDLYLLSYDTHSPVPQYCIVQIVREGDKPFLWLGIVCLMVGVVWQVLTSKRLTNP